VTPLRFCSGYKTLVDGGQAVDFEQNFLDGCVSVVGRKLFVMINYLKQTGCWISPRYEA
jgi:hypothetical protein